MFCGWGETRVPPQELITQPFLLKEVTPIRCGAPEKAGIEDVGNTWRVAGEAVIAQWAERTSEHLHGFGR